MFVLTVVGFGSKAGLLPLHAWLPRAHPEAPSPVSALMSAAMVNLGIYGIVRIDMQVLGAVPLVGPPLMVLGAASAVFGVLQASVSPDLKRLLAYSTTENMGLIALALGASMLLGASGLASVAAIALVAALVHLAAHAAFKALGFLAAGSVLAGTGLRDLDRLGGLARRMPFTTVLFGIAALGATGLPLGAGFVGEWLLLQSLIHTPQGDNTLLSLVMPLAVGRARAHDRPRHRRDGQGLRHRLPRPTSLAGGRRRPRGLPDHGCGMGLAGRGCVVVAVAPVVPSAPLGRVAATLPSFGGAPGPNSARCSGSPGAAGSVSPASSRSPSPSALALALLLARWGAAARPSPPPGRSGWRRPRADAPACNTRRRRSPSPSSGCSTTSCGRTPTSRSRTSPSRST